MIRFLEGAPVRNSAARGTLKPAWPETAFAKGTLPAAGVDRPARPGAAADLWRRLLPRDHAEVGDGGGEVLLRIVGEVRCMPA